MHDSVWWCSSCILQLRRCLLCPCSCIRGIPEFLCYAAACYQIYRQVYWLVPLSTIIVALSAGRNVAAGMTGGLGYFYDEEGDFVDKVNAEIVTVQSVRTAAGEAQLRALLNDHVEKTGAAAC